MWKFGWCLATKELRRRRRQFTNAIWIPFSMPALNLMCPGSKSEIALLMFKWWILTLLVGMNLLGKFFWHVSIIIISIFIFCFYLKKYSTYLRFVKKSLQNNNDVLVIDILTKKSMLFLKSSTYIDFSLTTISYIFKKCFPDFKAINHHFLTLYVRNFQKLHFFFILQNRSN